MVESFDGCRNVMVEKNVSQKIYHYSRRYIFRADMIEITQYSELKLQKLALVVRSQEMLLKIVL